MVRPVIAALLTALFLTACSPEPPGGQGTPEPAFGEGTLVIQTGSERVALRVEVADSPEERARGLMFREELAASAGMVFLPDAPSDGAFWMKNTLIPLSVAFWDEDQRIQVILDMEPCREEPCPLYDPGVVWSGAVEVNQGFFERHGVRVGDRVRLERQD